MSDAVKDVRRGSGGARPRPFYPTVLPPEDGHPTSAKFEVVAAGRGRGRGLQARVAFRRGRCVAKISGVLVRQSGINTIQVSPKLHLYDRWFCRFLLDQ